VEEKAARTLATLRRTILLVSMPFFILSLLLPVYGKQIGASVVEIGLFFTAFSLMTVLLRPVVGWGLDRFGRGGFLIAGVETLSLAFLPTGLVWALLPSRLGRLADRSGRKPMMLAGLAAAAASSFVIPALGSIVALALLWAF
jgi:MFS family permease